MTDHLHYDELTALGATGELSDRESEDLRAHLETCAECRESAAAYGRLTVGLGLADRAASDPGAIARAALEAGARDRFLARAMREGVQFSSDVEAPARVPSRRPGLGVLVGLTAAAAVAGALFIPAIAQRLGFGSSAQNELARVQRENASLTERLTARDRDLSGQQEQLRRLQTDLQAAVKIAGDLRRAAQPGSQSVQSTQQTAQLLDELENRQKQLAAATDEITRINQLRVTDRAALDTQQAQLRDVFDRLRIANATIETERELVAAGKDLLSLVLSKELRVIDVRDTDATGKPGQAFARMFVSEGQSIRIVAFDLNEGSAAAPSRRFQVWGEQVGATKSVRNLGSLDIDDRTQNRWSLTVRDPNVVKSINSVFVTASTRADVADGPRLLYTYLRSR